MGETESLSKEGNGVCLENDHDLVLCRDDNVVPQNVEGRKSTR